MTDKSKSIYVPIETKNEIYRIQTLLTRIMGKKPKLYEVIDMLIALQVKEALNE